MWSSVEQSWLSWPWLGWISVQFNHGSNVAVKITDYQTLTSWHILRIFIYSSPNNSNWTRESFLKNLKIISFKDSVEVIAKLKNPKLLCYRERDILIWLKWALLDKIRARRTVLGRAEFYFQNHNSQIVPNHLLRFFYCGIRTWVWSRRIGVCFLDFWANRTKILPDRLDDQESN